MQYIVNAAGIVFFHSGKPLKIEKSSAQYAKVIQAFDLPEEDQEAAIEDILLGNSKLAVAEGFVIKGSVVSYKGEELPKALAQKVLNIVAEGIPTTLFVKFWENLKLNPSSSSVNELFDFLAVKELPITEDGCFLAYKGLDSNFWSISGNSSTKVIKGKVDSSGRIFNGIGEEVAVERRHVDDNRRNHCSHGLHVGALEYADSFARGKLVVVKVNPKDVVSVPTDHNCQKARVSAYTVVSLFEKEIVAPVTTAAGKAVEAPEKAVRTTFTARVEAYLTKKENAGESEVSVKAIRNAFSPDYPSEVRVIDAVNELGYIWKKVNGKAVVIL